MSIPTPLTYPIQKIQPAVRHLSTPTSGSGNGDGEKENTFGISKSNKKASSQKS